MKTRLSAPARHVALATFGLAVGAASATEHDAEGTEAPLCRALRHRVTPLVRWVGPVDTDGDGAPDEIDVDDDGDGIPDALEGALDLDGDGLPDALDLDADGDGLPDAVESVPTVAWREGRPTAGAFLDTDGDGHPDWADADADGDGLPDALEAGFGAFAPVDVDRDGLADDVDPWPCAWGPPDAGLRDPLAFLPDSDGDAGLFGGELDWRDPEEPRGAVLFDSGSRRVRLRAGSGPPRDAPSASTTTNPDPLTERLANGQEEDMGNTPLTASSGCSTTGRPLGLGGLLLAALSPGVTRRRRKGAAVAAAGLLAVPGLASAQDPRLDIDTFDQNTQPATFTIVRDAEQTERGTVSGEILMNYGYNPFRFVDQDNVTLRGDVIQHYAAMNLSFNAAPLDWLELGAVIPAVAGVYYSDNNNPFELGGSGDNLSWGDLTVQVGVSPLQQDRGALLNVAMIPRIVIPTGKRSTFTSSGSIKAGGDLAVGMDTEWFRWSVTGGYLWQDDSQVVGDVYEDDVARWGAAVGVPFALGNSNFMPSLEYQGQIVVTDEARRALVDYDWNRHAPMELLATGVWSHSELPLYAKLGIGGGPTQGWGAPNVRFFASVGARSMPRRPEAVVAAISDADGDGIADEYDVCPYKAEDLDGFQDADGCPDTDNDNDGIADVVDTCPMRPEVFNDFEDDDGCPDAVAAAVVIEQDQILLTDRVYFEYDRAQLRPVSKRVLDEVAQTLLDNPGIQRVEIGGHADERGAEWYNVELARQRAMSVRNYLIAQGVDADRLTIQSYGEDQPLVENAASEPEYALNRRVQLRVDMTDGGLDLDDIKTVDADVPALPEGFDPPNTDNDEIPG